VLNAARQVGGAIGVAAFGALVSGVTAEQITSGLTIAVLAAAALLIVATVIALSVRPKLANEGMNKYLNSLRTGHALYEQPLAVDRIKAAR